MSNPQFHRLTPYIPQIIEYATKTHPLPQGTILNVNFPRYTTLDTKFGGAVAGIKFTRQGKKAIAAQAEESDTYWLQEGYITIVPIYVQDLTHCPYLNNTQTLQPHPGQSADSCKESISTALA